LTTVQVEELHEDIQTYLTLEQSEVNMDFWTVSRKLLKALIPTLIWS